MKIKINMKFLDQIRQKPDNQKRIIAFSSSIFLTLVIVLIWFSSNGGSDIKVSVNNDDKLSSVSPFQTIKEEFSKIFSNANEGLAKINEQASITLAQMNATSTASSTPPEDLSDLQSELNNINLESTSTTNI